MCSRTKTQLQKTKKAYFQLYDRDLRAVVKSETGGDYGHMMFYAMSSHKQYVAEVIDKACAGYGCDERALLDLFVMFGQERLYAGKKVWEDLHDKSLIDYINKNIGQGEFVTALGKGNKYLKDMLLRLLKDPHDDEGEVDEEKCTEQVAMFRDETQKWGLSQSFDEDAVGEAIASNSIAANQRCAVLYENAYNQSLVRALEGKCGSRRHPPFPFHFPSPPLPIPFSTQVRLALPRHP